jgi:carbonic anhydrase
VLEHKLASREHLSRIQNLVDGIVPGLAEIDSQVSEQEQLNTAVEANVRWSIHQILETTEEQNAIKAGARLVGLSTKSRRGTCA